MTWLLRAWRWMVPLEADRISEEWLASQRQADAKVSRFHGVAWKWPIEKD